MNTGFRSQQMREDNDGSCGRTKLRQSKYKVGYIVLVAGLSLCAGTTPAAARPQDDVLSAAFKCAAIADLRTWLDCYYGAAQPQRAALGLPSVSAAQARLVAAPPSGTPPAQDMALRDDVLRIALDCNRTATGRAWLDCFYAAAEPARLRLGLASSRTAPKAIASAAPPSEFGLPTKPAKTPDSVSARMTAYEFDNYHRFTATLDNGEVWQQIAGDDDFADWNKPASTYRVTISRGIFGSYNFRVLKSGNLFKVRRIR